MNLGCIHGGNNPNRICGQCELGFEIRPLPGMDMAILQQMLNERILPFEQKNGVAISLHHYDVPAYSAAPDSKLAKICESLTNHPCEAVSFATEAPYLEQLGMDVMVLGPGNVEQAHQPDEYLALNSANRRFSQSVNRPLLFIALIYNSSLYLLLIILVNYTVSYRCN